MIDLAAQFRFWTAGLSGISDADWVKAALRGDKESALLILQLCYLRTFDKGAEKQDVIVRILYELTADDMPLNELQNSQLWNKEIKNNSHEIFLAANRLKLGDAFHGYLKRCFEMAKEEYGRPQFEQKRRRKNWLAIGFNLAWRKDNAEGQSENLERNSDITQSVYLLIEQYDKKHGNLRSGINRFLNGESDALPGSIDRLIKLKGFIDGGPYIDHYRKVIARLARRTIKRFESAEKKADLQATVNFKLLRAYSSDAPRSVKNTCQES